MRQDVQIKVKVCKAKVAYSRRQNVIITLLHVSSNTAAADSNEHCLKN